MAVLVKSSPRYTVKGHDRWLTADVEFFLAAFEQMAKLGYN